MLLFDLKFIKDFLLLIGCTFVFVLIVYSCHGSWTENSTVYMVAKHAGSQHGVCITYKPFEGTSIVQIVIGDACHRGTQPVSEHHLNTNVTIIGELSSS